MSEENRTASFCYRTGDFNMANVKIDCVTNIATVTVYKHGWSRSYTFKARNIFTDQEEILEDEVVNEQC